MKRTTIFLTETQVEALKVAAKPDGITWSALIRVFINEGLARRRRRQK
jgi:hypothetical protein